MFVDVKENLQIVITVENYNFFLKHSIIILLIIISVSASIFNFSLLPPPYYHLFSVSFSLKKFCS